MARRVVDELDTESGAELYASFDKAVPRGNNGLDGDSDELYISVDYHDAVEGRWTKGWYFDANECREAAAWFNKVAGNLDIGAYKAPEPEPTMEDEVIEGLWLNKTSDCKYVRVYVGDGDSDDYETYDAGQLRKMSSKLALMADELDAA